MKLYRPLKSNYLTQGFSDNLACVKTGESGKAIFPYQVLTGIYPSSCPINSTKLYSLLGLKSHGGYDLACWFKEPIYHSGEFEGWMKTEIDNAGGIGVDIISNEKFDCTEGCLEGVKHNIKLRYWHLAEVVGFDKKPIKMGDLIGLGDSTGLSSGNHLHWSLKWCDESGSAIHNNNGWFGAFDQTPFYEDVFVLDVLEVKQQALTAIELARRVIFEIVKWLSGLREKVGTIFDKIQK